MKASLVWSLAIALGSVQLCAASAKLFSRRWEDVAEKHSWVDVPRGWEYVSPAPADYEFDMRVGLKQDKVDDLTATLMETSDPTHAKYGKHLTVVEAEALAAPHPDSVEAVDAWLEDHGVPPANVVRSTGGGGWVVVRVSVAQAERLLGTKYNVYHHTASSERVVRALSYSLPRELHPHVDVVTPTTYFGTPHSMRRTSFLQPDRVLQPTTKDGGARADCASVITPACLRELYNTASYVPRATNVNKLGVAGFLGEWANRNDLQKFFAQFRPDAVNSSFSTVLVNGGLDNQNVPGVEANLDIQYTTAMSFPTPNIYYSTGGSPPFIPDSQTPKNTNEPYLEWLSFVLSRNKSEIPQTITISYGDDEQTVPKEYAVKVCNLFAQLGAVGTTVFVASGDSGVGGGDCLTNDGTKKKLFQPAFPASCPFVTVVGGTHKIPETAVDFSGGGFSRYFGTPAYQNVTVAKYVKGLGTTYAKLYNPAGRAYPDLAAQAYAYQVIVGGALQYVAGTSASSPTVAGVFALLNDFRLASGKPSLGFINPLIYSTASKGFNAVVSGSNPGCGTAGFPAKAGWNPVTGLGTPDFEKLQKLI
ncbi:putative pro-kumamolisin, activation domain [Lyophyllum shimeji]|uniref:tripeptidyl-peptidase II n=1 Tax=Lyophyllum shimeji TaxID=47721 RepID=A0A9P3UPF4_LYOSH|nr:putative pro-kumamolisin, activation domain [Lyophyllum shimeji]